MIMITSTELKEKRKGAVWHFPSPTAGEGKNETDTMAIPQVARCLCLCQYSAV
jgi:hypothetical protein